MDARVRGILGDVGACKTLYQTYMLYQAHLRNRRVVANYTLHFPFTLLPFSEIAKLPPVLQDADVGLDELGVGADSYDFFESQPRQISKFCLQIRKRHSVAWYTAQEYGLVAKRIRTQTRLFFLMENLEASTDELRRYSDVEDSFKREFTRKPDGTWVWRAIANVTMTDHRFRTLSEFVFDGRKYRNLYNTDEIIW